MVDHRSYTHNLSSCEIKAWKKFRHKRDSNPWPLRYQCSVKTLLAKRHGGIHVSRTCLNKLFSITHLRWPNTVFARAFADAIQQNDDDDDDDDDLLMSSIERSFYLLKTRIICAIFSLLLNAVYWWL